MSNQSLKGTLESLRNIFKEHTKQWHYNPKKKTRNLRDSFPIIEERIFKYNENNHEDLKVTVKRCKKEVASLEALLNNKFQTEVRLQLFVNDLFNTLFCLISTN